MAELTHSDVSREIIWRRSRAGYARIPPPHNNQMLSCSCRIASFARRRAPGRLRRPPSRATAASWRYLRGVAVSCGDLGMAKRGMDRVEIYTRPKKLHGERMPEDVRRYGLTLQAWPSGPGLAKARDAQACKKRLTCDIKAKPLILFA